MINLFKKNIYPIILFLSSLFIFLPTFEIRFSWIDDGWDILVAKRLIQGITTLNFELIISNIVETSIGRFRPIYWLWQTVVYAIGGSSSYIHYFLHYLLIFSICLLIYNLILYFSKSPLSSLIGSLLFIFIPINTENFIRLGPAEPIMIFFILLSLLTYFKLKNVSLSIVYMLFAFLTKETAIAIVPTFISLVIMKFVSVKKFNDELKMCVSLVCLSIVSIIISLLNRKGYSSSYVFNLNTSIYNFKLYLNLIKSAFPLGALFVTTFIIRNIRPIVNFKFKSIKEPELIKLFFLVGFICFIAIQSPWAWVLNRYTMPAIAMACIFIGLEISSLISFLNKQKHINILFIGFLVVYASIFIFYSVVSINEQIMRQRHSTENIFRILKSVAEVAPQNGKVYFNFKNNEGTMEPLFEADLHLKLFLNRQDIKVGFVEDIGPGDKNYLIVSGTPLGSFKYIDDTKLLNNKKLIKFDSHENNSKFLVISNFKTVSKQLAKNIIKAINNRKGISTDGIYTDYLLNDNWRIYYY